MTLIPLSCRKVKLFIPFRQTLKLFHDVLNSNAGSCYDLYNKVSVDDEKQ